MPTKRFLRFLILLEIVIGVAGWWVGKLTESLLPEQLQAYQQAAAERDFSILGPVALVFLTMAVAASIGLFVFWPPARWLYLATIVSGFALTPFIGPYVDSGWAALFGEVASLVEGIILALIFFSPLRELYTRRAREATEGNDAALG